MNNRDYKKLQFICTFYEEALKHVIGAEAFTHLSKLLSMEILRMEIYETPEGDYRDFLQWLLDKADSQTDEEWQKEWGGKN